jgi:DNA mismatch endonuclease, patch repair protein
MTVRRAPAASSPEVARRMRAVQRRDTQPELLLRSELHRRGYRFRVQYPVPSRPRRRLDVAFPKQRVAVEVRGCYWHGCQEHGTTPATNSEWWSRKFEGVRARDADTEHALTEAGWTVVVVWEHEDSVLAAERVALQVDRRR